MKTISTKEFAKRCKSSAEWLEVNSDIEIPHSIIIEGMQLFEKLYNPKITRTEAAEILKTTPENVSVKCSRKGVKSKTERTYFYKEIMDLNKKKKIVKSER